MRSQLLCFCLFLDETKLLPKLLSVFPKFYQGYYIPLFLKIAQMIGMNSALVLNILKLKPKLPEKCIVLCNT